MRDILTGLALLLIVLLTAALAGPYFVDWTQHRPLFEEKIGAAVGAPVSIGGTIDVVLLPTPRLKLGQVRVGNAATGPTLSADQLDLEISVMPLLRGDIRVTDARLREPQVGAALTETGAIEGLDGLLERMTGAGSVSIERLTVEDGTIRLLDKGTGQTSTLSDIDAEADAQTLVGPWRANGRAVLEGSPVELRLATGGPEAGGTRVKVVAQTYGGLQRGELDGRMAVGGQTTRFDGRLTVAGRLRWPDKDGYSFRPWSFVSNLKFAGRRGTLEGGELEAGGDTSPVKFTGTGELALGRDSGLSLLLEAKQIDLDRPYTLQGPAFVPLGDVVGGWLTALNQGDAGLPMPVPLSVSVKAGNIIVGGDTLSNVGIDLASSGDGKLRISRFASTLPGAATLDAAGEARLSGGGQFTGRVQMKAKDIGRLMGWFEGQAGGRSARVADAKDFAASADVALSPTVFAARNLRVTMDRSGLQGTVRYTAPEDAIRGRFEAQLTSDGLAIEQVPDVSTLMAAGRGLDVSIMLDARNVRVGQALGPSVGAGRVGLKLAVNAEGVQIDTLDIADVGGASVKASGHVGEKGGRLDATVDARKVEPLAELLRKLVPGKFPALLAARAPVLGPLKVKLAAERGGSPEEETRFSIDGSAAASRLEGLARIGGQQGMDKVTASLKVEAPDAAAFLSQLGFDALPLPGFGRGRLSLDVEGRFGGGASLRVSGEAAGTTLNGTGRIGSTPDAPDYAGTLALDSADVGPILQILALPGPDGLGRVPFSLKSRAVLNGNHLALEDLAGAFFGASFNGNLDLDGDAGKAGGKLAFEKLSLAGLGGLAIGNLPAPLPGSLWPSARFQPVMAPPYDSSVALTAKSLDLGFGQVATGFAGQLHWSADMVELSGGQAAWGGGQVLGGFGLRRQGGLAGLSAKLGLRGVPVSAIAPQAGLGGRIDADLDGTGSGETATAMVGSLSGGGQLKLRDLSIPRLAPAALGAVTTQLDAEQDPPDLKRVRDLIAAGLDRGPLGVATLDTPLTVSNGLARIGPMALTASGVDASGTLGFDLRTGRLEARASLVENPAPPAWSGPLPQVNLTWRSGRQGTEREVDVAGLANVLTTRAVSRELERIEAMEADLRERSFFVRRLKVERELAERERLAAEQARLAEEARKAEEARVAEEARRTEEARKAEEVRKADEARRLDEARQAEAARQAEEAARERDEAARAEADKAASAAAAAATTPDPAAAASDNSEAAAPPGIATPGVPALDLPALAPVSPSLRHSPVTAPRPPAAKMPAPPAAPAASAEDRKAFEEAARIMGVAPAPTSGPALPASGAPSTAGAAPVLRQPIAP